MISIILPVYNEEKNIKEVIQSLLNQDFKNFELIIIDDCSTDNTSKILTKIKHQKLKILKSEKNSGPGHARNIGIKNANGNYILFFDSDVKVTNNKFISDLNHWMHKLNTPKLAGLEAQQIFPTKGNFWQKTFYQIPKVPGNTNIKRIGHLFECDFASTTASLWKRKVIKECNYLDKRLRLGDDMKLSYLTKKKGYSFFSVPVFVEHQYRTSLKHFLKEQFWYGVGGGINLREGNQHLKWLCIILTLLPIFIIPIIKWPWLILTPFLLYLPSLTPNNFKYWIPLLITQYLKHTSNLIGTYTGILFKTKTFTKLKGRH